MLRLSLLFSRLGLCSRREADVFLTQGRVSLDGAFAALGAKLPVPAVVRLSQCDYDDDGADILSGAAVNNNGTEERMGRRSGDAVSAREQHDLRFSRRMLSSILQWQTVILNKPREYVSSQPQRGEVVAMTLLDWKRQWSESAAQRGVIAPHLEALQPPRYSSGFAPAGRLDKDSRGLLLYTQSGSVARSFIGHDPIETEIRTSSPKATIKLTERAVKLTQQDEAQRRANVNESGAEGVAVNGRAVAEYLSKGGILQASVTPNGVRSIVCSDEDGNPIADDSFNSSLLLNTETTAPPEKEYLVLVGGTVTDEKLHRMRAGKLEFRGRSYFPCVVEQCNDHPLDPRVDRDNYPSSSTLLRFVLREGRNRQIRRMCEKCQLEVLDLHRVRIGDISLESGQFQGLPEGEWAYLFHPLP